MGNKYANPLRAVLLLLMRIHSVHLEMVRETLIQRAFFARFMIREKHHKFNGQFDKQLSFKSQFNHVLRKLGSVLFFNKIV